MSKVEDLSVYVGRVVWVKNSIHTRVESVWGSEVEILKYYPSSNSFKVRFLGNHRHTGLKEGGWGESELVFPSLEPDWEV